jgi:hypothetical protein
MDPPRPRLYDFGSMTQSQWKCRICGFDRYYRVRVVRKSGVPYETPFHACSGCSAMFMNPTQFNVYSAANPSIEFPTVTPLRRRGR